MDDHEDSGEMLKLLLSPMNYQVQVALSFEQALQLAQTEDFDLYVLDKRLPDGSGIELCKRLNEMRPSVPCIFYTGDTYELHRQEALSAGANAYVPKPDVEKLIDTVHKLLSERECATT